MSTAGEISGNPVPRRPTAATLDFFIEPSWCVDALIYAEEIPGLAWDPACGCGTIPKALRRYGIEANGTDIADRDFGSRHDFLSDLTPLPFANVRSIVMNPPYALAQAFIERALDLASDKVAALVQSKFPYSQRRHRLFTERPPARIYFLSNRPSMPPGEKLLAGTVEAKGGKLDYMWIVWARGHKGPTQAHWLSKPKVVA